MASQQKQWKQRLEILIKENNIQTLENSRIAVFGIGGVGGYAAEAFARCGVGTIILVDYDTVDVTNLNRQIIALTENVGNKKVDEMEKRILAINPSCNVIKYDCFVTEDNIKTILQDQIDGVVDAIDTVTSKLDLIKYCLNNNFLFISALGTAGKLDPLQVEITTLEKTSYDPLAKALRRIARQRDISTKFPIVYSREQNNDFIEENLQGATSKEKYVIGSSIFVPATAGLAAASYIIRKLINH